MQTKSRASVKIHSRIWTVWVYCRYTIIIFNRLQMEHSMQWRAYKRCKYISQYFKSTVKNTESFIHSYKHKVNIIGFEIPMHIHNYRMKGAWWRIFMQQQRKNGWILPRTQFRLRVTICSNVWLAIDCRTCENVYAFWRKSFIFPLWIALRFFLCVCIRWGILSLMVWN